MIENQADDALMTVPGMKFLNKIVTPNPPQPPLKNAPDTNSH
jgi:hypothetical protein